MSKGMSRGMSRDGQIERSVIRYKLQHPASPGGQHMPGASPLHFIVPQLTHVCHRANATRKWRRDRSPL